MAHLLVVIFMSRALILVQRKLIPNVHDALLNEWLGFGFVLLTITLVLVVSRFTHQWIEVACQKKFRDFAAGKFTSFQSETAGKPVPPPR
jgi:peptidoglycan/LPS O-acetylase OafA/YrhL